MIFKGFLKLAQTLINLGAECGKIDVSEVMPSRRIVKSKIIAMGQEAIDETAVTIQRPLELRRVSFTTDMYHNQQQSVDYIDLSADWIDDDFDMRRQILFCQVKQLVFVF